MDKVKAGRAGAGARYKMIKNRPTAAEAMLEGISSYPCILEWSDGSKNPATLGTVFDTEEDYQKYKQYKDTGKPYPVKIEAIAPAEGGIQDTHYLLASRMCDGCTAYLQKYLEILPLQQIEEATRIMEQQAAEATAAMEATLPDLEGADL